MAICWECGIERTPFDAPPKDTKHHKIVGWVAKCGKCGEVKTVFSNVDFGLNPDLKKEATNIHNIDSELKF